MHCAAHRLALAIGAAAKNVMPVNSALDTMDSIYKYYEKSTVRTSGLKEMQVCDLD